MKRFLAIVLVLVYLFTSCGDNSTISSDTSSKVTGSEETVSAEEAVSSEEVVSEVTSSVEDTVSVEAASIELTTDFDIDVEWVWENNFKTMTEDGYGWDVRGLPEYLCDWVNDNQILFYTMYSETDGASVVNVRIFLHSIKEQTTELIGETQGATLVKTFKANGEFYLLHQSSADENNLFKIDLENKKVEKSVVGKISGAISKDGKILHDGETFVKICDFLSGETEIEFEKTAGYNLVSWSPDGRYMAFNKHGAYKIYDLNGDVVFEIKEAFGFNWCQTPDFFTYQNNGVFLVDLVEKEVTQINAKSSAYIIEPEFSLFNSAYGEEPQQYMLLNHKTENELYFRLDYKEKNDGTHFVLTNYNPNLKAFVLTSYSTLSHEMACVVKLSNDEDERPVTRDVTINCTTKKTQGCAKKDFGRFYMWFPDNPSNFEKLENPDDIKLGDAYDIENGTIYFHTQYEFRVVAELVSVDYISNPKEPFLKYDEQYLKRSSVVENLEFDEFVGKSYTLREWLFGDMNWADYVYVYCIKTEKAMIVMNYYSSFPGRGMTQHEFEMVLNSIEMK